MVFKICKKGIHQYDGKQCKECQKIRQKAYREANPKKCKAENKAWREANPEKSKIESKAWREANPKRVKELQKVWNKANPDKRKVGCAKYRAKKFNATIIGYDKEIELFYKEAKQLEKLDGKKRHVHHIVPLLELNHLGIFGEHAPWNLEILTEEEHKEIHKELRKL